MTLCGGSSQKTDRGVQLGGYGDVQKTIPQLNKLGTDFLTQGKAISASGAATTSQAAKYFSDILSGDPAKVMEAAAPEINAMADQADAQKRQIAVTGNRSGGTNAITQGLSSDVRGATGNVIAGQRGEAAKGLTQIGETQSREGLAAEGMGLQGVTGSGDLALNLVNAANASRQGSAASSAASAQAFGEIAAAVLLGF